MTVTITFEIPDDVYRTLLPLMTARGITSKQLARGQFVALAERVTAGKVPLRKPRPRIPARPPAAKPERVTPLSHEEQQTLQTLYVEHKLRANMVADIMGVSASTVQRYVELLELPRHPRGTTPRAVLDAYERLREGAAA
ncbi:MAG: hypothetical protein AB7T06_24650 [Kofleriaceae bacterium]